LEDLYLIYDSLNSCDRIRYKILNLTKKCHGVRAFRCVHVGGFAITMYLLNSRSKLPM